MRMRKTTAGRWAAERRQEEEEEIGLYKAWGDAWPDDPAPRGAAFEQGGKLMKVVEFYDAWESDEDDQAETLSVDRGTACEDCILEHALETEWVTSTGDDVECQWCSA